MKNTIEDIDNIDTSYVDPNYVKVVLDLVDKKNYIGDFKNKVTNKKLTRSSLQSIVNYYENLMALLDLNIKTYRITENFIIILVSVIKFIFVIGQGTMLAYSLIYLDNNSYLFASLLAVANIMLFIILKVILKYTNDTYTKYHLCLQSFRLIFSVANTQKAMIEEMEKTNE
jgi:hypothetical protein